MLKSLISLAIVLPVTLFLLSGCSTKELDAFLTKDHYRMVSKQDHDKQYPNGHQLAQNSPMEHDEIPGNKCIFDKIHNKYFCQFPFYDDDHGKGK